MSIKLSETQHAAISEVAELGYTVAKANTIKSLESKGLIEATSNTHHKLTTAGREYLGMDSQESVGTAKDNFTEVLGWTPDAREEESLESLLQGDPWKLGDAIAEDEAHIILDSDAEGTKFDKFDSMWDDVFKITAGFGAALDWRGTEVWDGLTAQEIAEDIETATPVNRKARRAHYVTLRNAFRRMSVERPRKALKITGKVGV